MGRYRFLFKNVGLLALSSFTTKLLSFFLVPLYTNILTTTEYGTYDLFNTIIVVLLPILTLNIQEAAKQLNIGEMTLEDIVEELKKPGRDIRDDFSQVKFESSILTIDDLNEGMVLEGTVTNIMDFGCFVDIGVHVDGLVHISEMSSKYVKSPHDIVKLQQVVKVKIISLDKERKRIGLSLKQVNN